ncbi:hypothetical protein BO71DRAFT_449450 [Aspergillus ellipticus CBS 707.79]|uniref:Uncharacterized protein n=1 Tax=Aspergillus ellipticus CBS 707.79 TaxID=1448320 RepID=A0A319DD39_9EURO|nr:hypothetical protein BO71DRAFT_449450 [Aspergillus ellipticus CBS 707.79]
MEHRLPTRGVLLPDDHEEIKRESSIERPKPTMSPVDLMDLSASLKILPVPTLTDALEATSTKLTELAKVVEKGNSLALFTGLQLASQKPRDPETVAKESLTTMELEQYESWKRMTESHGNMHSGESRGETMKLPGFNWETNLAPVPQGAQSMKKFTKRAAAMDIVFGHQGATPEHAAWLTSNMIFILPLIKAVTKVSNIGEHLESTKDPHMRGLTDMEVAELETVRKLLSIVDKNRNREMEKIHRLMRSINESMSVLKARAEALEKK